MINLSDLQNTLILIFANIQYNYNDVNNSAKACAKIIAIINFVALAHFFKAIYFSILKYLLTASSKNEGLLDVVSTYFGIIEINSHEILYLHCLVWLCDAFHIL